MHINVLVRESKKGIMEAIRPGEWAGVDRGAYLLLREGIHPKYTYGDFDSVDDGEWTFITRHMAVTPVPTRKDDTDLEICLKDLVAKGYLSIDVYGATGGRLDHTLANIFLLTHSSFSKANIRLIDHQNIMQLLPAGQHTVAKAEGMRYVSFLPLAAGGNLSLEGFEYDLDEAELEVGRTLTISNEFKEEYASVHTDATIIMIQSRDDR
ncbi:thiamine diphosphokinase [Salinicoccus siamensis]|uniref:Thiamine diphosphokinase n=1 Tax=Salinicoccus siamensis TaxID=381830 RepID=A0ABV5Z5L6_9STAP